MVGIVKFNWVYIIATGEFQYGGPCDVLPKPGEGIVSLLRHPDPRTERYDGAGGVRAATSQEISTYDAGRRTAQTANRFDDEQLVKALAIWTAGKLNVPLATARAEIVTILKGL